MIFAVDPGNERTAWVLLDETAGLRPLQMGLDENDIVLDFLRQLPADTKLAIEMVANYGMAVGRTVFETVFWIGRFYEAAGHLQTRERIFRMEEKLNLCHNSRAKDSNIRQALIDRFGDVGTKKDPGWFYGVKKDIWAAIAVGVTYADTRLKTKEEKPHECDLFTWPDDGGPGGARNHKRHGRDELHGGR